MKEAIILAGGLGTRLRNAVPDLPKCMAPVAGKPFLSWLVEYSIAEGVENFIFALGYKSESFESFLRDQFPKWRAQGHPHIGYGLSVESEPLGTGGAIRLACSHVSADTVMVMNGDTLFRVDAAGLARFHADKKASCTLCLKPMRHFDRYGVVELDAGGRIGAFREKQHYEEGLINGGVYALDVPRFLGEPLPEKFSFENWLERPAPNRDLYGLIQDGYFIDIGIPEDYERAQREIGMKI